MEKIYDVLIVGGGPAGYTAALYTARAGLSTLVLEKLSPGGQMALTEQVDNYPGFPDGADGFALGQAMRQGAERFGAETRLAEALSLELSGEAKRVKTSDGAFWGRTVILAMGASPRELGLPGEQTLMGKGISYCATCDGMFYREKTVAVIGGGNTAATDALLLSRLCERVILVYRRDSLRADQVYQERLFQAENVEFRWNSRVTELLYDERITGIKLVDVHSGLETTLDCDGVFVCIGQDPASGLVRGSLPLNASGYIVAEESTKTEIPGVFAAGDVRTKAVRQIVTAVSDGAVAAHYAQEYLTEHPLAE